MIVFALCPRVANAEAVSSAGTRLLKLLGHEAKTVKPMIGLEQEFFLVPREAYYRRPDLQLSGRTVMGADPPRGQELSDHYMAPLNPVALACMKEMQHEAFKMGIPLNTRHREVAPNQYEVSRGSFEAMRPVRVLYHSTHVGQITVVT